MMFFLGSSNKLLRVRIPDDLIQTSVMVATKIRYTIINGRNNKKKKKELNEIKI